MDWQTALAFVSAVATVAAVYFAWQSARESKDATRLGKEAVEAAKATATVVDSARRADERDRLQRRYERIGELVEAVFWAAEGVPQQRTVNAHWMEARNRLAQALVGLLDRFPKCVDVLNASNDTLAFRAASEARIEVEARLRELDHPA